MRPREKEAASELAEPDRHGGEAVARRSLLSGQRKRSTRAARTRPDFSRGSSNNSCATCLDAARDRRAGSDQDVIGLQISCRTGTRLRQLACRGAPTNVRAFALQSEELPHSEGVADDLEGQARDWLERRRPVSEGQPAGGAGPRSPEAERARTLAGDSPGAPGRERASDAAQNSPALRWPGEAAQEEALSAATKSCKS